MKKHAYSDAIFYSTIAILGPLPPPLGGVSVHIERVIAKLKKQKNRVYHFQSTQELRYRFFLLYLCKLVFFLLYIKPDVLMYHTTYLSNALLELRFLVFLKKIMNVKIMLIEHDCRFVYALSCAQKKQYQYVLDHTDMQVCIGSRTIESFVKNNMYCKQQVVESAFLPPDVSNREQLLTIYPSTVFDFMQKHTPVILANAFQLRLMQGKDLYGFDQLVEAFACYKKNVPSAGLVLMLAQKGDVHMYATLQQQIMQYTLESAVYILEGNYVLWPLFAYVDLFVRPTLSDGASVSIEEALYFKVPVIASDVCWRPPDCILYKQGGLSAQLCKYTKQNVH